MLLARVREVLGRRESEAGCDDSLDGGIVCQVHEEHDVLHGTVLLEVVPEESCRLHVDTHSAEDDAEVLLRVIHHILAFDQRCLSTHLGSSLN